MLIKNIESLSDYELQTLDLECEQMISMLTGGVSGVGSLLSTIDIDNLSNESVNNLGCLLIAASKIICHANLIRCQITIK